MKGIYLTLSALAAMCVDSAQNVTHEECVVQPTYTFYTVEGDTVESIEDSLRQRGPRDDRGKARFAYTDWTINWRWKKLDTGLVDTRSLDVECRATINLPRLQTNPSTPIDTILAWNDFVARTRQHELAHLEHVQNGARLIGRRLAEHEMKRGAPSPARANKIVSQAIQELRELDIAYDARTNHGAVEGTWGIKG